MKKIILSLAILAAGITAFAAPSARVKITLGYAEVTAREDVTPESYKAFGTPSVVLNVGGTRYSEIQVADIEGMAVEYIPTAESFNLTFNYVIGDLYLVDANDNSRTKIVDGMTLPVTATAAEVAAAAYISRFSLSKIAEQNLCFVNNVLQLSLYKGETVEIYEGDAATATMTVNITTDVQDINLSDKTAGRYRVKLVNADKEYLIDVHPEQKAADYKFEIVPSN